MSHHPILIYLEIYLELEVTPTHANISENISGNMCWTVKKDNNSTIDHGQKSYMMTKQPMLIAGDRSENTEADIWTKDNWS